MDTWLVRKSLKESVQYKTKYSADKIRELLIDDFTKDSNSRWTGRFLSDSEFIVKERVSILKDKKVYISGNIENRASNDTIVKFQISHSYLVSRLSIVILIPSLFIWIKSYIFEISKEITLATIILTVSIILFQLVAIFIIRLTLMAHYEDLLKLQREYNKEQ
jgi:hypothetical protein